MSLGGDFLEEVRNVNLQVLGMISQWREYDPQDRQALIEIGAKASGGDLTLERCIRSCQDADIGSLLLDRP
jgi:hypothetical protein